MLPERGREAFSELVQTEGDRHAYPVIDSLAVLSRRIELPLHHCGDRRIAKLWRQPGRDGFGHAGLDRIAQCIHVHLEYDVALLVGLDRGCRLFRRMHEPVFDVFSGRGIQLRERIFLHFSQKAMVDGVMDGYRIARGAD